MHSILSVPYTTLYPGITFHRACCSHNGISPEIYTTELYIPFTYQQTRSYSRSNVNTCHVHSHILLAHMISVRNHEGEGYTHAMKICVFFLVWLPCIQVMSTQMWSNFCPLQPTMPRFIYKALHLAATSPGATYTNKCTWVISVESTSAGLYTRLFIWPHPLTRRNGLVNQVEFLGLAHTFATV